ncbi:hypothetical protein BDR26DRAFT_858756 [Obelidium mucronatum]|nr:hypothetical protein BDR26DRAFT_858756 [Obelidium mucronatum]
MSSPFSTHASAKKRFSFIPSHSTRSSSSATIAASEQTEPIDQHPPHAKVSFFHPNPHLSVSLQHPPSFGQKSTAKPKGGNTLISPSELLQNPSLIHPHSNNNNNIHQHPSTPKNRRHHHQPVSQIPPAPPSSATDNDPSNPDFYTSLDSFTLISKLTEMIDSSTLPSNSRILKLISMTKNFIDQVNESGHSDQSQKAKRSSFAGEAADNSSTVSDDGARVVECFKRSLQRLEEFVITKNEGELLQNVFSNLKIATEKESARQHESIPSVEHADDGASVKKKDVVHAFKDLLKLAAQVLLSKSATELMVNVLRIVYDVLFGSAVRDDDNSTKELRAATPSAPGSSISSVSSTSQHANVKEEDIIAESKDKKQGLKPRNEDKKQQSAIAVPHAVLADIVKVLASHFLPPNLFKRPLEKTSENSDEPPIKAKPVTPLSKTLAAIESRDIDEKNDVTTAPAQDLINILTTMANAENDAECDQLKEQMTTLLESVEILYIFANHFLDDKLNAEETPGRGNLIIAIDLFLKFLQRFVTTSINPLKNSLVQLTSLMTTDIIPKHRPIILHTLQCLRESFSNPELAVNQPDQLHQTASDFRQMVFDFNSVPLPPPVGETKYLSSGSVGEEIGMVAGVVKNVWKEAGENEFIRAVALDGVEWWKALFVDEEGAVVIKLSLWKDFTNLVLPAILVDFKTLTFPKLSYTDDKIKFDLENVIIDVEAMMPNLCQMRLETGVLFGFSKRVAVEYTHGITVKLFQIHSNMVGIPFRARRSGCMRMSEEGFMDVSVANRGITVSVHLELDSRVTSSKTVTVNDVKVEVEDVMLRIYGTKNDAVYRAFEKSIAKKVVEAIKQSVEHELKSVISKWDAPMTKLKQAYSS